LECDGLQSLCYSDIFEFALNSSIRRYNKAVAGHRIQRALGRHRFAVNIRMLKRSDSEHEL